MKSSQATAASQPLRLILCAFFGAVLWCVVRTATTEPAKAKTTLNLECRENLKGIRSAIGLAETYSTKVDSLPIFHGTGRSGTKLWCVFHGKPAITLLSRPVACELDNGVLLIAIHDPDFLHDWGQGPWAMSIGANGRIYKFPVDDLEEYRQWYDRVVSADVVN
ncbi:MAG: hypothetical protein AAF532_15840 [Planctomycetota bacterium]